MLFSVITINFQNVQGLKKTIESVAKQTSTDFEYIVIDGGSTDGSTDLIQENCNIISYWESKVDNGIYHAMNKGWKNAKGKFCIFLNSGDHFFDSNVLQMAKNFIQHVDADIYYGNLFAYDSKQSWISKFDEPISLYYFQHNFIPHPSTFIKRNILMNLGGYYEHYKTISDWAFFVRAFLADVRFVRMDIVISAFLMQGTSSNVDISNEDRNKLFNNEFKFLENDFLHFERLRHFDTSILTRFARILSSIKIKYFG